MNSIAATNNPVDQKIVLGYLNSVDTSIARKVLPPIEANFDKIDIKTLSSSILRIVSDVAEDASLTQEVRYTITKASSVAIESHRLKNLVTRSDVRQYGSADKARQASQIMLASLLNTIEEYTLANTMADTSVLTNYTTLSGTSQWSDYDNSNPLGVFKTGRNAVYSETGLVPNTVILSWQVWNTLKFHPQLLDALGKSIDGKIFGITPEALAKALEVEQVLIGKSVYNSAKEGATPVMSPIWGKHAWIGYVNPNPSPLYPENNFGYTFWGGLPTNSGELLVDSYPVNDPPESEYVRVEKNYDQVILSPEAMYLIKNAIA